MNKATGIIVSGLLWLALIGFYAAIIGDYFAR